MSIFFNQANQVKNRGLIIDVIRARSPSACASKNTRDMRIWTLQHPAPTPCLCSHWRHRIISSQYWHHFQTKWNITCRIADAWMQKAKRLAISFQYWHDLDQTDSQLKCTDCKILNTQENINSVCIVLRKWSNKKSSEFVGASLYSAPEFQAMNLRNRLEDCIALERLKRWYCPENYDIAHQPWQSAVKLTGQLCLSQPFRQTLKRVICFENLEHIFTM